MKTRLIVAIFIVGTFAAFALQPPHGGLDNERRIRIREEASAQGLVHISTNKRLDGVMEAYNVTRDQISRIPEWNGMDDPPLEISKALTIARATVLSTHPDFKRFRLREFESQRIIAENFENRWYYIVSLEIPVPKDLEKGWKPELWRVRILMDGTVIVPELYPKD